MWAEKEREREREREREGEEEEKKHKSGLPPVKKPPFPVETAESRKQISFSIWAHRVYH